MKKGKANPATEPQFDLFGDFNGIDDFGKKVGFGYNEGHGTNRMILGASLLVMNS